jgi:hypothetical protein
MSFEFGDFLEKRMEGQLETCYVSYKVTVGNEHEDIAVVSVTGERDELVDFETAVSDEALEPLEEMVLEHFKKGFGPNVKVVDVDVKFILVKVDQSDLSTTFLAFKPDGFTVTVNFSAEENFDHLVESLFED